ncbi:MAG TPA: hypothetical protein DCE18_00550, partial [Syntrophobacteraceae bacterium]|nr:hypothetical protein [Syntrophobacteraceae bacterium]
MAEILPFRGLRFNPLLVSEMDAVVTPPYDVISPEEQDHYHRLNPHNMIYLELGQRTPQDNEENNPHTRAAVYLHQWQSDQVLVREEQPAIYYYTLDYAISPQVRKTRYGFICALRLEDFRTGCVRPHERTFQAVKDERLRLMSACHANLSPVFALYSDTALVVDHHLQVARESKPIIDYQDSRGQKHRIWRVFDRNTLQQVRSLMRDKPIFIADGHHRYETALAYRDMQRKLQEKVSSQASHEFIMVYLSNMNQTGLTILPTHRMLRHLGHWKPREFVQLAEQFFEVSTYPVGPQGKGAAPVEWDAALRRARETKENCIGFYWHGATQYFSLRARRNEVDRYLAGQDIPAVLHSLDVVILDQVVLRRLLGLSDEFLANEHNIHFKHDLAEGLSELHTGHYDAGFFINPTRIEQVQEVASAGLIMPHKS